MLLSTYSHPVSVNALNSVVSMTTLEVSTPSCPIFFAMTKQLTVVAEPSMTRIATSSSLRNPSMTARGRNTAANPTSFITAAAAAGLTFAKAFLISKVAPIAISPRGVATAPTLDTVFYRMGGIGIFRADQRMPAAIPIMIGFVTMPFKVDFQSSLSSLFRSGWKKASTTTAITL